MVIFLITSLNIVVGQTGFYYKYDFERFVQSKVKITTANKIKEEIKYPPILRENAVEGFSKFMIKSDGNENFELIQMSAKFDSDKIDINKNESAIKSQIYLTVKRAFEKNGVDQLILNSEKCFTEFTVLFDIEPYENIPKENLAFDMIIKTEKIKRKQSTSHMLLETQDKEDNIENK